MHMDPPNYFPQDLQVLIICCSSDRTVVLVLTDDRYLVGKRVEFQSLHQHIPAHRHHVDPVLTDDLTGKDNDISLEDLYPGHAVAFDLCCDQAALVQTSGHALDYPDVSDVMAGFYEVFSICRVQFLIDDPGCTMRLHKPYSLYKRTYRSLCTVKSTGI